MARQRPVEELSVEELRHLLMEKRRLERQARLEGFRKTGRLLIVSGKSEPQTLETLRSGVVANEPPGGANRKRWLDQALFLVEAAAVAGLIFVLFNGVSLLQNLNREVAAALVQPTLTPTPVISAVVLPAGHTPPDVGRDTQPNEAEIPEHLRPLVQSLANVPLPTPGPQQAVRIQIPALGVDAPVVQGDGWEQLKKGVGQHAGTPDPGQDGNIVLSAHNDVYGELFRHLDELKEGDRVVLFTHQETHTYVVRQVQIVEPTRVEVMAPTGEPVVTLISCYPYLVDNQRIVVTAYLEVQS